MSYCHTRLVNLFSLMINIFNDFLICSTFTFKIFSAILIVFAIVSCAAQHFITNITIFNGLRNNEKKDSSKTDLFWLQH
ncbi:hypothetical protein BpHYR1_046402 [Brachionus plicatilis]|uniref:Uncharacterized protein n=1 Tax=Brachionus plicatilis TaxID=10195 RepID=A0A3M7RHN7_BRAPC|nr:hypothetical protein BpHYR1_046402 [Brachionus plicatilis]